ncbi:Protein VHS3 [Schistosoma japonicum]|nr:Protein VHS3 [Schistosoma japonicum]
MVVEFVTAVDCLNATTSNATLEGRRLTVLLKEVYLDNLNQPKQSGQLVNKTKDQEHNQQSGYNNQRFHHRDQRDYGQRNQRDYNQRNFNNRDHTNQRENGNQRDNNQRDYSGQRDYNRQGRQFDYNSGRGERDVNRFQGGQTNRGGPRDFGRNDRFDRSDQRRDRSPARGEPVRGYGSSKGPRITSAVIHRPGNASPSESSSSEED